MMPIPFLARARHQYRRLYFVLRWVEDLTSPSKPGSKCKPLLEVRRQQHGDIFPRPPHAEEQRARPSQEGAGRAPSPLSAGPAGRRGGAETPSLSPPQPQLTALGRPAREGPPGPRPRGSGAAAHAHGGGEARAGSGWGGKRGPCGAARDPRARSGWRRAPGWRRQARRGERDGERRPRTPAGPVRKRRRGGLGPPAGSLTSDTSSSSLAEPPPPPLRSTAAASLKSRAASPAAGAPGPPGPPGPASPKRRTARKPSGEGPAAAGGSAAGGARGATESISSSPMGAAVPSVSIALIRGRRRSHSPAVSDPSRHRSSATNFSHPTRPRAPHRPPAAPAAPIGRARQKAACYWARRPPLRARHALPACCPESARRGG